MTKPIYVKDLIDNIWIDVKSVSPKELIERINPKYEIPHLRDSIVNLLRQYRAQINILETAKRIVVPEECTAVLQHYQYYRRGIKVYYDKKCGVCQTKILKPLLATGGPGRNYLPASVNNICRKKECACRCPDRSNLYDGKHCCKSKHSKIWDENNPENPHTDDDTIVVLFCKRVYHGACINKDNPKCVI